MNINIQKSRLEQVLAQIIGITNKKQTMLILENAFLELKDNQLIVVGSDSETEITTVVPDISGNDGKLTSAAHKLYDICRTLPSESTLSLTLEEDKLVIKSGKSGFRLLTLPADNYPRLEEITWEHEFSLSQAQLKQLLNRTAFNIAQNDVRYFLNGLLLEINKDGITTVATDGHRLAKSDLAFDTAELQPSQSIIPRKTVLEVIKFIGADTDDEDEVDIKLHARHILLRSNQLTFTSKLIDGRFPDYEKVIPANLDKRIVINRDDFIVVLNRVAVLCEEPHWTVSLTFSNGLLQAESVTPEQEIARDEMEVDYSGEDIKIGFNVNYLLEALNACEVPEVELSLLDTKTSGLLRGVGEDHTLYLIMPVHL